MLRKLSLRNARRQAKDYLIYFITVIIAVSLLFAFNALAFSQDMSELSSMFDSIDYIITFASVLIVLIIGWLVYYMSDFMLKKRSRELGTYMLLGIEHKQVANLFFMENIIIGTIAVIIGFFTGNLVYQVVRAIALNSFGVPFKFQLIQSSKAVVLTVIYALFIFLFALIRGRKKIAKMKIYDLMYYEKKNEEGILTEKKNRRKLFGLSCIAGAIGIFIFFYIPQIAFYEPFGVQLFIGSVCLIFFLYGFYISLAPKIISWFDKDINRKYKQNHMFLFRTLTSKVTSMSVTMATLALLFTLTVSAIGIGMQMEKVVNGNEMRNTIYDLSISMEGDDDVEVYEQYLAEHAEITDSHKYNIYQGSDSIIVQLSDAAMLYEKDLYMKRSDYDRLRSFSGMEAAPEAEDTWLIHCLEDYCVSLQSWAEENPVLTVAGRDIIFGSVYSEPFDQFRYGGNGYRSLVVVPDEAVESMAVSHTMYVAATEDDFPLDCYYAISQIAENKNAADRTFHYVMSESGAREENASLYVMLVLPLYYVAFILMIAVITILVTQQLSDAGKYKYQYGLLSKLGMGEQQLARTLWQQFILYFSIPTIPPLILSSIVIYSIGTVAGDGMLYTFFGVLGCIAAAIGIFLFIYIIYFAAAYVSFKRTVLE